MPDFSGARAFVMDGMITVADDSPLHRARAISGLIDEETLVSERLGRLTDRVAAVLLEANLFSIRVPQADGGAQRHKRRSVQGNGGNLPRRRVRRLVHGDQQRRQHIRP